MPFFLDCDGEGLDCFGGEAITTSEEGCYLVGGPATPNVAIDGNAIFFDSEEKGDFDNVSDEVA